MARPVLSHPGEQAAPELSRLNRGTSVIAVHLHGLFAGDKWNIATTENAVAGWGGYQKPKKTQSEIDLQRRRELGMKHLDDIETLQAIAAKSRKKITRLPPVPEEPPAPVEALVGPCQEHVQHWKAVRVAKTKSR
jgi:hypothetical protein